MTTRKEKIFQLRKNIETRLRPLIDRDYALLGLPYYLNIGDTLIWEGERHFLDQSGYKCLNKGYRYNDHRQIHNESLILLQGGGNFGDLWRYLQDERLDIVRRYKHSPIVIFPVTVWYENHDLMCQDAAIMSEHPNLTICARDQRSYDLLTQWFTNRILLVPDMAFCIQEKTLNYDYRSDDKKKLFLKRTDKELSMRYHYESLNILDGADIRDWPSYEKSPLYWLRYRKILNFGNLLRQHQLLRHLSGTVSSLSDCYFHTRCRKRLIQDGIDLIAPYRSIYTTRLHAGILSILLDKEVTFIDNTYGKNSDFFKTWLKDTDGVTLWKEA